MGPQPCAGLAGLELFADVPAEALLALQDQCRWTWFDSGDAVLSAGLDREHGVYFVVEGTVELYREAGPAASVLLARVPPGEYFGEFAAVDGRTGSVSARAAEPTLLAELPRAAFVALLAEHPPVPLRLLRRHVGLIRSLNDRLSGLHRLDRHVEQLYCQLLRATL